MTFNDFSMVLTAGVAFCIFLSVLHYKVTAFVTQCSNKLMLSYFKYYSGYAAAFRPDVWGCGPTSGRVLGCVEISLVLDDPLPPGHVTRRMHIANFFQKGA